MFLKNRPKSELLAHKWLWEPSVLIRPEINILAPTFWMPASSVVSFSATVERLKCFIGGRWGERWLEKTQTISLHCGGTPSPGKIEYNCRYFIKTFRKLISEKKFGKICFHTLQGTMFHRPLTNTSSLKAA